MGGRMGEVRRLFDGEKGGEEGGLRSRIWVSLIWVHGSALLWS